MIPLLPDSAASLLSSFLLSTLPKIQLPVYVGKPAGHPSMLHTTSQEQEHLK